MSVMCVYVGVRYFEIEIPKISETNETQISQYRSIFPDMHIEISVQCANTYCAELYWYDAFHATVPEFHRSITSVFVRSILDGIECELCLLRFNEFGEFGLDRCQARGILSRARFRSVPSSPTK